MVISKTVLIAGGTGFIGYNIANKCVKQGYNVISISKNRPKQYRELKKVRYIQYDLINEINSKLSE